MLARAELDELDLCSLSRMSCAGFAFAELYELDLCPLSWDELDEPDELE